MEQKTLQIAELLSGGAIDKSALDKLVSVKVRELSVQSQQLAEGQLSDKGACTRRISEPRRLREVLQEIVNESVEPWVVGLRKGGE